MVHQLNSSTNSSSNRGPNSSQLNPTAPLDMQQQAHAAAGSFSAPYQQQQPYQQHALRHSTSSAAAAPASVDEHLFTTPSDLVSGCYCVDGSHTASHADPQQQVPTTPCRMCAVCDGCAQVCPITLSLFQDPVCNALGQVYERAALQRHLLQVRMLAASGSANWTTASPLLCSCLHPHVCSYYCNQQVTEAAESATGGGNMHTPAHAFHTMCNCCPPCRRR